MIAPPKYLPFSDTHLDLDDPADCPCRPVLTYITLDGTEIWNHRDDDGDLPDPINEAAAIMEASIAGPV